MSLTRLEVMSLSKVIKDSGGFVPEKIVAKDLEDSPVWGNLVKHVEPEIETVQETTEIDVPTHDSNVTSQSYDSDFSAPEIDEHDTLIHSDASPVMPDEQNIAEKMFSQEELDLALEESYSNGVQAGMDRMESDYGLSVKTLQSICEQLNTVRETILKNSMSEMRELVLLIAEKIIRHSISSQKETIVKTVEDAIQQAVKSDEFIISVNPDDYITIKTKSADFINSVTGLENIIVRSDASIDSGGCLIESSNCTVDATLVSQLEIIAEALQEK